MAQAAATVPGLNVLLKDLRGLDKESQDELRDGSKEIAGTHMVPAFQRAAENAGPWGGRIAATIKAKRDRVPAITIGAGRKAFSGGATVNMVRFPSDAGQVRPTINSGFTATGWLRMALPDYIEPAMAEWGARVDHVVSRFNAGRDR